MANQIKIDADISKVRKSLLDVASEVKKLQGKSKVSLFDDRDKKFLKQELSVEMKKLKMQFKENKDEMVKLVDESRKLKKGSEEELKNRKAILKTYKDQAGVAKSMGRLGGGGSSGGGMLGKGMLGVAGLGVAALGYGVSRISKANSVYGANAAGRTSLAGLGVDPNNLGGDTELGMMGLDRGSAIGRMVTANRSLGREGGSLASMKKQASFERSMGLEGGSMLNVSTSLRGGFGGKGADQAQSKIQASILAAGIEDALAPYLEATTSVLEDINEQGMRSTDDIIKIMARATAMGGRTPEQLAPMIKNIDQSIKGATGEKSAIIQDAYARGGIGGGTIGGVRLAMMGGISGFDEGSLLGQKFNPELIKNMRDQKMLGGEGDTQNVLNALSKQIKDMAGVSSIGEITETKELFSATAIANRVLGTNGMGGASAVKLFERLQDGEITKSKFDKDLKDIQEGKLDPVSERLEKVNSTLSGQLTALNAIQQNTLDTVGQTTIIAEMAFKRLQIEGDKFIGKGAGVTSTIMSGIMDTLSGKETFSPGRVDALKKSQDIVDGVAKGTEKGMKKLIDKINNNSNVKGSKVEVRVSGDVSDKVN